MRIRVRLLFNPPGSDPARTGELALVLPPEARVGQAMTALQIAPLPAKVILVNGRQAGQDHPLGDGDLLVIFPPVEGG